MDKSDSLPFDDHAADATAVGLTAVGLDKSVVGLEVPLVPLKEGLAPAMTVLTNIQKRGGVGVISYKDMTHLNNLPFPLPENEVQELK